MPPNLVLFRSLARILLAAKGAKMARWHCRVLLQLNLSTYSSSSERPVNFEKNKTPGVCYGCCDSLQQLITNPSGSLQINTVNLLPCCVTAGLFYEETLTPFPGDKTRLSLQEMVDPVWIHKQFKVLTFNG